MKTGRLVALSAVILYVAATGLAQEAPQPPAPAPPQGNVIGNIQVRDVGIAELDTSHVKVTVDLTLVSGQTATLKDIQLCSLRLNALPVFAEPLHQEVLLRKGVSTALPPVYITVLVRDLSSVEPLKEMIEKQNVHVQGELVAGVQLSFLEKLALHTQHPTVEFPIVQDVPVNTGATEFQRNLALSVLSLVNAAMGAKDAATPYIPGAKPAWVRDIEAQAKPNLYWIESSYALTEGKTDFPVTLSELGFSLASGKVIAPSDVMEPWKYDAEFLGAVKSGAAKLVRKSQEIQLQPATAGSAPLKQSAGDFTVVLSGVPEQDQVTAIGSGNGHGQVQVLRRASPSSLAVLTLHAPASASGLAPASAEVAAQDSWDKVAVFRVRVDPATGERRLETLQLEARKDGNSIRLTQPVDAAVFGSPIMTPDGVIGMVQDEQSGAFLPQPAPAH